MPLISRLSRSLRFECMDVHVSYDLNSQPEPQGRGALVLVSLPLVVCSEESDDELPDPLALLWQYFCKLAVLFLLALVLLKRLRAEIIELRRQANMWKAQHQRAVAREAVAQCAPRTRARNAREGS